MPSSYLSHLVAFGCVWPCRHPLSLCAVLILTASLLCVAARANSLSSCCSSDCRVGTGVVMTSGGLPYISKPASCWRHLPRPRGGLLLTSCCAFAACTCFQVTPCMLRNLSACLLDLERFSYGRGRSMSLLPCPAMSTLTSCLACMQ